MTIKTQTLSYTAGQDGLKGYIAYDDANESPGPGVMVIHEWWGLDDYIRTRADRLAELGYTALAIDMYGNGDTAGNPNEAGAMMNAVLGDMETGTSRLKAAHEVLCAQSMVDETRTAAIGYCFGGAMVLHMARIGMPLKAVVSFHGALRSFHAPAAGEIKSRILICHGAADSLVPESDIKAFNTEMATAQANVKFESYEGALHGFTNPDATERGRAYGLPLAYDESADHASWSSMQALLNEAF
tara:strand:- start:1097 stop:1825 length:729 start_codon:yes stop_codon:yes gene_type:complete